MQALQCEVKCYILSKKAVVHAKVLGTADRISCIPSVVCYDKRVAYPASDCGRKIRKNVDTILYSDEQLIAYQIFLFILEIACCTRNLIISASLDYKDVFK